MFKKMKTKLKIALFVLLLSLISINTCYAANTNILLNGKQVAFTDETGFPYVDDNNRTMVPLRVTMESAGFVVGYDNAAKTAIVITEYNRIEIPIDTNKIYVNNTLKENDTIATIKDGRTYLPIRIILEAAHYTVEWDNNTQTVNAYTYSYDEENFMRYSTNDPFELTEKLLKGDVVYINGDYYATPEYIKLRNTVQVYYTDDDLNTAIYPQKSRFDTSNLHIEFPNESDNDIDGIIEGD